MFYFTSSYWKIPRTIHRCFFVYINRIHLHCWVLNYSEWTKWWTWTWFLARRGNRQYDRRWNTCRTKRNLVHLLRRGRHLQFKVQALVGFIQNEGTDKSSSDGYNLRLTDTIIIDTVPCNFQSTTKDKTIPMEFSKYVKTVVSVTEATYY